MKICFAGSIPSERRLSSVLCRTGTRAEHGEGYYGIGKDFLDMENMLVLADEEGIFGSFMSDSTRAMVTEKAGDILVVIYCFENDIDLEKLLDHAKNAFEQYASVYGAESWIV